MPHPLWTRLRERPVLTDGAMGTMLYQAGIGLDDCFDALNVSRPEVISQIHRAYIAAGADLIETNTYGANRYRLETHGLADRVREINRRAVKLAREEREVSGRPVLVAGSVGPTGRTPPPYGVTPTADIRAAYEEQIEALLEGGVDLLMIETIGGLEEMRQAVEAAKAASDLPVIALMTFAEDGRTLGGGSPEEVVRTLLELKADGIGANCSVGPAKLLPVVRAMARWLGGVPTSERPVLACLPNAGWPSYVGGRVMYPSSAEYFGGFARDAAELGLSLIGGCCGTTPEHTAAMRLALDDVASRPQERATLSVTTSVSVPSSNGTKGAGTAELIAPDGPTEVAQKLNEKFLISVEIDPPKGFNPAKALDGARLLREAGVDAINVADSPMARVRMSAMTLCYLIQHQVGIETIVHFTTRDRSLMGLQSELLGAHAVGVRNILALTGDPPSLGDYPDSSAVYDVDSIGLIRVLGRLNAGTDSGGASIGRPASFTIACAVDPTKPDLDDEARRLRQKLDAGAHFVMTQPIYDLAVWDAFLEAFARQTNGSTIDVPVMLGILPLQSSRHAEFLHNEVPGITLTDAARDRMRRAGSEGRKAGVEMARDLLLEARPHFQGVYLMPSFGRYEVAAEVLEAIQPTLSR